MYYKKDIIHSHYTRPKSEPMSAVEPEDFFACSVPAAFHLSNKNSSTQMIRVTLGSIIYAKNFSIVCETSVQ